MKEIYLDYSSTTPIDPEVIKDVSKVMNDVYGNPSSMHLLGRKACSLLKGSRKRVAKILNTKENEIIFTGSGTESDNMAILGVARANRQYGNKVLISAVEHKAVTDSAKQLELEGFIVEEIPVDEKGFVNLKVLEEKIDDKTILISVIYGNNEIGTINPIKEISEIIKKKRKGGMRPYFHTDACQAVGFLEIQPQNLGVDLLSFNGSKIYGPKGVGVLYIKEGIPIEPIIHGGGQENNKRSGTENLAFISGLALALETAEEKKEEEFDRLVELRDWFIKELSNLEEIKINGDLEKRLPNNIHVSFKRTEGESLLLMLDNHGICASTGSACSANDLHPSHVLVNIGLPLELVHGSLRFSLGRYTTKEDLEKVIEVLPDVVEKIRSICPSRLSSR